MTDSVETLTETGEKLIDATQSAIIDVAENVSHVLENAAEKSVVVEKDVPFYTEIEFWIGVAFVLTIFVLYKYAGNIFKSILHKHSQKVITDIEEAVALRDDAQKLLADYERKALNVKDETAEIINTAQQNLKKLKEQKTSELKKQMQHKQNEASQRMAAEIETAKKEINSEAGNLATLLAEKAIKRYIDNTDRSKLIDEAIESLDKIKNPE